MLTAQLPWIPVISIRDAQWAVLASRRVSLASPKHPAKCAISEWKILLQQQAAACTTTQQPEKQQRETT